MPVPLPAGVAGRANRAVDSLHAMLYFAPESDEELTAVGLRPGRMCYFASRSAPMGAVSAGVTTATFYNFNPALVARHIPRAWGLASLDDILAARVRAADRALRRLLGDDVALSPVVEEAAELARAATVDLSPQGRPLYAAHAELPWPTEPHLLLWHAVTLLREYRGDGHVATLLGSGLTGLDALITHTATGRGFTVPAAKATRGWSDDEWDAAADRLQAAGILDGDGGLTAAGLELRESVERATDELGAAPWITIGPEATDRLIELGRGLSRQLLASGAFSAEVFARSGG
ncbi:MAG: hypothetical protein ABR571_13340 [Jatrophihabitans sp.]|uniref:SCO6745 family protein n=1 Tax=Jatrophihabitans sp. TaxID=1932789 RepID=UPI003915F392